MTSTLELTFQKLSMPHLETVLEIERQSFKTPWSKFAFIHEMRFERSVFKVAKVGDHVVGYGGFWHVLDEAHISNIAVHPDHRRKGIGRRLLSHLLEEAVARGALKATLEVRRSNIAAQKLYESFGFKIVTVRKYYYSDENEDALIMWNDDIAATLAGADSRNALETPE
ncbi:ribosomal protein S18-alanine N-acetyltransferase [Candidatus Poribacteria bacterium]|nr:ribosomal protein S18-alanine N-acetyltransferase [Candidatus Poribacteria bacterium]